MRVPPEVELAIEAHGEQLEAQMKAGMKRLRQRRRAGIPDFLPGFKNKTLEADQAAYAAYPTYLTDAWNNLRRLVLAARIDAQDFAYSYRNELCSVVADLTGLNGGECPKRAYSLKQMGEHVSRDDLNALVWAIWKQNPESVRRVPNRRVWTDEAERLGTKKVLAQVFLTSEPDTSRFTEAGLCLEVNGGWRFGMVDTKAYQPLRGWKFKTQT